MNDVPLSAWIVAILIGFFVGIFLMAIVNTDQNQYYADRALSCMQNGNSIGQCETVLGIPQTQK